MEHVLAKNGHTIISDFNWFVVNSNVWLSNSSSLYRLQMSGSDRLNTSFEMFTDAAFLNLLGSKFQLKASCENTALIKTIAKLFSLPHTFVYRYFPKWPEYSSFACSWINTVKNAWLFRKRAGEGVRKSGKKIEWTFLNA